MQIVTPLSFSKIDAKAKKPSLLGANTTALARSVVAGLRTSY